MKEGKKEEKGRKMSRIGDIRISCRSGEWDTRRKCRKERLRKGSNEQVCYGKGEERRSLV